MAEGAPVPEAKVDFPLHVYERNGEWVLKMSDDLTQAIVRDHFRHLTVERVNLVVRTEESNEIVPELFQGIAMYPTHMGPKCSFSWILRDLRMLDDIKGHMQWTAGRDQLNEGCFQACRAIVTKHCDLGIFTPVSATVMWWNIAELLTEHYPVPPPPEEPHADAPQEAGERSADAPAAE